MDFDQEIVQLNKFEEAVIYKEKKLTTDESAQNTIFTKLFEVQSKSDFLRKNISFIKENWTLLLSPETLIKHRDLILENMLLVFGELTIEIENKGESDKRIREFSYRIERDQLKKRMSVKMITIVLFWRARAAHNKKILQGIGRLIEQNVRSVCDFCQESRWGLRAEPIWLVEDVFMKMAEEFRRKRFTIGFWQEYFLRSCPLRTICFRCSRILEKRQKESMETRRMLADEKWASLSTSDF